MIPADQLPPQNLEAELCVIGSMLLDNETIDDVTEIVEDGDFYRDTHQLLFRAIRALRGRGIPVDAISLVEALQRRKQFDKAGGDDAIRAALEAPPHAANAKYYAHIVREKSCARRVIQQAMESLREAYSNEFSADELVENFERRAFAIGQRASEAEAKPIDSLVDEAIARFEQRSIGGGGSGLLTGFGPLDAMLGGFRPRLYILGARPGCGKSSLALNIADNVATEGEAVLFFSLEMDDEELTERFIASRAGVNSRQLRVPAIAHDDDRTRIYRSIPEIQGVPLSIVETAGISTAKIASTCRRHKARNGLGLVVIDYVQLIIPENRRDPRQEQMAGVSRDLMRMAKEIDAPVLALAQLNREVEKRPDARPRMSDLKESGQFEADAHGVMLLYRPKDRKGMAELIVPKNRGGATGSLDLWFDEETTTFTSDNPNLPEF